VALTTTDILAQIIFDTGASLAISPLRSDFVADPTPLVRPTQLGGMGKGLQIEGVGTSHGHLQQKISRKYNFVSELTTLPPQKRVY
jgi:hypothetical protein